MSFLGAPVRRALLLPATVIALGLACGDEDPAPGMDESSSSGMGSSTTGMASNTNSTSGPPPPPPMTTAVDDTTFGPGCGPDPCDEICMGCPNTATCIASEWMCECECPMTGTEGDGCPTLEQELDTWVEPSKTPAIGCGVASPEDDAMVWQMVHDCVVLSAEGSAFTAWWTLPEGEDPYQIGVAARVGAMYERGWFEVTAPLTTTEYGCDQVVATPDCMVDVGQMCLTCEAQAEVGVLCEEM